MQPRSVLIEEGQHEGDTLFVAKFNCGESDDTGEDPFGTVSLPIHPEATPPTDKPSYGPMPVPETGAPTDACAKVSRDLGDPPIKNNPAKTATRNTPSMNSVFRICI